MRCNRVDRLLERYLDGVLTGRTAEAVRNHLARCPRCAASERLARTVARGAAAADPAAGYAAPAHLAERVMAEVYRLPLPGGKLAEAGERSGVTGGFRRLGLSFISSAILLAASLLVGRGGYSSVVDAGLLAADLGKGEPTVVMEILRSAGGVVEGLTAPEAAERAIRGGEVGR